MFPMLPGTAITSSGGVFTFTGSGGATQADPSNATVNIPNPILVWTNQSDAATVNRGSGVKVTWTGGAPSSYVSIEGSSSSIATGATASFNCIADASALQFTVPAYVTSTLPAGTGRLLVENTASFGTFTAPGLDFGAYSAFTGDTINNTYQ